MGPQPGGHERMRIVTVVVCAMTLAGIAFTAGAADEKMTTESRRVAPAATAVPAAPAMPALPKPGPEQEILKTEVGTWDATVESWMEPGKPPLTSKGTETNALLGGLWLTTDFKGEFMGTPFQ